jgi:Rha family phage regulatory protein
MRKTTKPTASASQTPALVEVAQARPTTTSRIIAKQWGRKHFTVVNAIEKQLDEASDREFIGKNFLAIEFVDARGRVQREWQMTEDGFAAVAMGFTGKRSLDLRIQFTKAFREANERLRELESRQAEPGWKAARVDTKLGHALIGFALKTSRQIAGKDTEVFHYQNEAKLIRHAMLGTQEPLCRDCLDRDELKVLARVEHMNAELIAVGEGYQLRKAKCRVLALQLLSDLERRGRSLIERNGLGRGRLAGGAA